MISSDNDITSAKQLKESAKKALEEVNSYQTEVQKKKDATLRIKREKFAMMGFLFICAAAIIIYILPSAAKFKYEYELDKPWIYENLTASTDFSIYKSDAEIEKEYKALIAQQFKPYFSIDDSASSRMLNDMIEKYSVMPDKEKCLRYATEKLKEIYFIGVISADQMLEMKKSGVYIIKVRSAGNEEPDVFNDVNIDYIYTTKKAYEEVIESAPESINKSVLRSMNLNEYICENMTYEENISNQYLNEIKKQVSTTKGIVQEGQKIISKGDLVTEKQMEILNSLKKEIESKSEEKNMNMIFLGQVMCVFCILIAFYFYMSFFRERFIMFKNVFFMLGLIVTMVALTSAIIKIGKEVDTITVYLVPYALVPITISSFFDTRTALFTHLTTILMCSLIVPHSYEFLLMQTLIGMICISTLKYLYQRSQLVKSAGIIVLVYAATYLGMHFISNGNWEKSDTIAMSSFLINGGLLLFAYPLIFIMEKLFSFISDVTLVELSNTNNPLLKELSEAAPGTFNHSLQVANLASDAAMAINANPMLVRAGAMYHDIGKILNPIFFTENQHGFDPHKYLSEKESVKYILNHVSDGASLARKRGLPQQIIKFIEMHHGQNVVRSFYNTYCNKHPEEVVDEKEFSYPGKRPDSKETVIVMICDSVEAASRSLGSYTNESISNLVDKIVKTQVETGAFSEAPITFREIETVKNVLKEKLKNIYHTRVHYPELIQRKKQ